MATKLCADTLAALPEHVAVPKYERRSLRGGIVHFGVSNFHRSHQATYLDELFNLGVDHDWAIVGAGVRPSESKKAMREQLAAQDYLMTVVEQDADVNRAHISGAMVDFLPVGDSEAIIARMTDPLVRIVSLTITKGSYCISPGTGQFDPEHPSIVADRNSPDQPCTVFGHIVAALKRRRSAGIPAFTVLSCDNIPQNGVVTRNAVVGLAALSDPALALWIQDNAAFPSGMVDRITPATGDRERRMCDEEHRVGDQWPVFCEPYKQWVLEDDFPAGRPALERVGVKFVSEVAPYELMKYRILNGGHAVLAYPSGLLDLQFAHDAMAHPLVRAFLRKVETEEIIPTVPALPDVDAEDYFEVVARRFANPRLGDTVRRLCLDGSVRQPKYVVATIADRIKAGKNVDGLALVCALWCRYCYGTTEEGVPIEPNDANWERLNAHAKMAKEDPLAWLAMEDIYGELAPSEVFVTAFSNALKAIWREGTEKTMMRYVQGRRLSSGELNGKKEFMRLFNCAFPKGRKGRKPVKAEDAIVVE